VKAFQPVVIRSEFNETLSGTIDGSNKVFTTTKKFVLGSTRVYLNGLKNRLNTDYVESDENEITMDEAPRTGDSLCIDYVIK